MEKEITKPGVLALADGTVIHGTCFGALRGPDEAVSGEVVFNTSMYGYQEILTDPSYSNQIMCFTYPQIGNVGCNPQDDESDQVHVEGIILRNLSPIVSNYRATESLSNYLRRAGKMGISGIDTRDIVTLLREKGSQMGVMACGDKLNTSDLVDLARSKGSMEGGSRGVLTWITPAEPGTYTVSITVSDGVARFRNDIPLTVQPKASPTAVATPTAAR